MERHHFCIYKFTHITTSTRHIKNHKKNHQYFRVTICHYRSIDQLDIASAILVRIATHGFVVFPVPTMQMMIKVRRS